MPNELANTSAVDRASRLLIQEHISELAWRVENISLTIQAQCAGGDDAGALHSLGRLYLTVTCLKDAEKMLKLDMMKAAALARAPKNGLQNNEKVDKKVEPALADGAGSRPSLAR